MFLNRCIVSFSWTIPPTCNLNTIYIWFCNSRQVQRYKVLMLNLKIVSRRRMFLNSVQVMTGATGFLAFLQLVRIPSSYPSQDQTLVFMRPILERDTELIACLLSCFRGISASLSHSPKQRREKMAHRCGLISNFAFFRGPGVDLRC